MDGHLQDQTSTKVVREGSVTRNSDLQRGVLTFKKLMPDGYR